MKSGNSRKTAAFSLVEVSFALGIFAFCLVSLLMLLPLGIKSGHNAAEEMLAMNAATAFLADLKATPKGMEESPIYGFSLINSETKYADDSWTPSSSSEGQRYRITTTILPSVGVEPLRVVMRISWPAAPLPEDAAGVVTVFGAFNIN